MLATRDILGVEILSVGTWQGSGCPIAGCEFTAADLDALVADYETRKASFQAPIKLGHDDNQKLLQADGYPAAGWLSNLRRKGDALLADLVKVPAKIADLIDVGAYANRSIELLDNRVTGLALLGADIPAVENLSDIAQWYSRVNLSMPTQGSIVLLTSHPMVSGTHSHAHPAYGAQGGDATHAHSHAHDGTASHDHHSSLSREFALPQGMSYDDLSTAVREAFINANPGASANDCWVSDLYDNSVIVCMEGRYWQQPYAIDRKGAVTMTDTPTEVARLTEWRAIAASRGMTYADNAERVLTDVQAFTERTAELARLRANDGRRLSETHRERLVSLRDGLRDAYADIERLLDESPSQTPDYSKVMQARARLAQLRTAEIAGAST